MQKEHSVTNLKFIKEFGAAMKVATPDDRLNIVKEYVKSIGTQNNASWVVPQAQAHLVNHCPVALGSDGKVSISRTFSGIDELTLGLMYLLKEAPGNLVSPAWKNPEYSVFVPLILAAYKRYADVPYSKWSLSDLKYVVSPAQCNYMLEALPEISIEQRISLREECKHRYSNLKTAYSPVLDNKNLQELTKYNKCILLQLWLAHPEVRHKDMWLDSSNPDELPDLLEGVEVITPHAAVTSFMNLLQEASKPKPKVKETIPLVKASDVPPWVA